MIYKRAAVFNLLLALSLALFPLSAYGLALLGLPLPFLGIFFFWPQLVLVPYGFVGREIGHSQYMVMDSAIYGAIAFWFICAVIYGYFLRKLKMRYVVLATYPVAFIVIILFNWALDQFGYSVYLEGP